MNDKVIASKSCKQPEFKTLPDASVTIEYKWGRSHIDFCTNSRHSTMVDLPVRMYDLLRDLVNDPKVVEYYETLRKG